LHKFYQIKFLSNNFGGATFRATRAFLFLFLLITIVSCTREPGIKSHKIRIGEVASLTGSESTYGQSSHRGLQLYIEETNAKGGVRYPTKKGDKFYKIELITLDNQSRKDATITAMEQLTKKENVLAVVGEVVSERTKVAAPYAQSAKIPLITPASTNPSVTEVGDYIFRACYIDPFQGFVMAKFARENLKLQRVAVFKDYRSNYSTGLSEYFVDTFTELGGEIVAEETYSASEGNFARALESIKKSAPDAIFIPGFYTQVSEIARLIRENRIKSRRTNKNSILLGGDAWDSPELFTKSGDSISGSYYSNHFSADVDLPRAQEFVKKYTERFNERPDGTSAMGYDAGGILIASIERALKNKNDLQPNGKKLKIKLRQLVRDEIAKTKNYLGVTGNISINKNRDAVKPAVIIKIEKGRPVYITSVSP